MTMLINKTKKELVVAELINGMIIVGEINGDKIEKAISIEMVQDEHGVGFRAGTVGNPSFLRKVTTLAGIPEIMNFNINPISTSLCISVNSLETVAMGDALCHLYNEVWTKVPDKDAIAKARAAAEEQKKAEAKLLDLPQK